MFLEELKEINPNTSKKDHLCDLRVLRSVKPNYYMIAVKLTTKEAAKRFILEFHKKKFNPIEEECCNVWFLDAARLFTDKYKEGGLQQNPEILFTAIQEYSDNQNCPICLEPTRMKTEEETKQPVKNLNEKLRGGDGDFRVTLLCEHTFHWLCLANWNETTCPLCRYHACP